MAQGGEERTKRSDLFADGGAHPHADHFGSRVVVPEKLARPTSFADAHGAGGEYSNRNQLALAVGISKPGSRKGRTSRNLFSKVASMADVAQLRLARDDGVNAGDCAQIFIDGPQVMVIHVLEIEPRHYLEKITIERSRHAA